MNKPIYPIGSSRSGGVFLRTLPSLMVGIMSLAGCKKTPADWVALVESVVGVVRLAQAQHDPLITAEKGNYIRIGGKLETGPASEALLPLRNGGKLTVKENSVVLFGSNAPEHNLSLLLEQGSVIGTGSSIEAAEFVIGVGQRKIRLLADGVATIIAGSEPKLIVNFGQATIEEVNGKVQTLIAGTELVLTTQQPEPPKLDGRVPPTIEAPEAAFYVQSTGPGKVLVKQLDDHTFLPLRFGEVIKIVTGTQLKLLSRAQIKLGEKAGNGWTVAGPAHFIVRDSPPIISGENPVLRLEPVSGELRFSEEGIPGKIGSTIEIDGVKLIPKIVYRRLNIKLRREQGRSVVDVDAGEANLTSKERTLQLEAGQVAVLSRGKIVGPQMPQPAPMEIKSGGTVRVFSNDANLPVSFRWNPSEGFERNLFEISRSPGMRNPLFSDAIKRRIVTVPKTGRGTLYWHTLPVDATGNVTDKAITGKVVFLKDTSFRELKDRQPTKNTIHESYGNTTVYYQNMLPRFTFHWDPMNKATVYHIKVFREQTLTKPLFEQQLKATTITLAPGKLGEGSYIWYVAARDKDGSLVKTTQSRKLLIRYDNATPDLQIVYPPNGLTVSEETIEVKGVTIPGSQVSINGAYATLDETSRFSHLVKLKTGLNNVVFLVRDPKRGSSFYLRQVTRK